MHIQIMCLQTIRMDVTIVYDALPTWNCSFRDRAAWIMLLGPLLLVVGMRRADALAGISTRGAGGGGVHVGDASPWHHTFTPGLMTCECDECDKPVGGEGSMSNGRQGHVVHACCRLSVTAAIASPLTHTSPIATKTNKAGSTTRPSSHQLDTIPTTPAPGPAGVQLYFAWLSYFYLALALRENVLKLNGSAIKGWWIRHHYWSAGASLLLLGLPVYSPGELCACVHSHIRAQELCQH
jgi:hypothetical protein